MGRIKKRLLKRKVVKRTIKRKPQHQQEQVQQEPKLTPEQKAKEVEMIKTMLMRSPAQLVGTDRQQDQLLSKLDVLNKRYDDQVKANVNLKAQIQQKESLVNQGKAEHAQMLEEERQKKERNKIEADQLKDKQKAEERKTKLDEKHEELQDKLEEFDETTEAGKHKKEMRALEEKKKKLQSDIDKEKKKIDGDEFYAKYKEEQKEIDALTAEYNALQQVTESKTFKLSYDEFVKAKTERLKAEHELEFQKAVYEKRQEILLQQAEAQAQQSYLKSLHEPKPKPLRNKDGSIKQVKGVIQYEKDNSNNVKLFDDQSIYEQEKAQLASLMKDELRIKTETIGTTTNINNFEQLVQDVINKKHVIERQQSENKGANDFIGSAELKDKYKQLHEEKAQLEYEEGKQQLNKEAIEARKKVKNMQAEHEIRQKYAEKEEDVSQVLTQIQALKETGVDELSKKQKEEEYKTRRDALYHEYDELTDKLILQYLSHKDEAWERFQKLIKQKTDGQLPNNVTDFNNANLEKLVDFTKMMLQVDRNILLYDDECDNFAKSDLYNKFDWDLSKTMLEE